MTPTRQNKVRALLRKTNEGLTAHQISESTGLHVANVRTALRAMPDVYVDRWRAGKRGSFEKVWIAVSVPEHCPHPHDKKLKGGMGRKPKTLWQPIEAHA